MNTPNLGDLGSFPTQGAPSLFRVGPNQPTKGDELTHLLVHFADVVVVAVVVAQLRRAGLGGSIGSMGKSWSYPSSESFIALMPLTLAPAVSQRTAISDPRTPAVWASSPSAGRHTPLVALASAESF